MSTLLTTLLVAHVLLGVIGLMASYAVVLELIKKQVRGSAAALRALIAFLSYMLSWISGGYYYVMYYGSSVKPKILEGDHSFGHYVFMEAKEHAFIMLPFAALALSFILYTQTGKFDQDPILKRSVTTLALVVLAVATVVTVSGILVSGSA